MKDNRKTRNKNSRRGVCVHQLRLAQQRAVDAPERAIQLRVKLLFEHIWVENALPAQKIARYLSLESAIRKPLCIGIPYDYFLEKERLQNPSLTSKRQGKIALIFGNRIQLALWYMQPRNSFNSRMSVVIPRFGDLRW